MSSVENSMPPTTATPSGARASPPAPNPSAIGRIPAMVESAVMSTGRKRVCAACVTASSTSSPCARSRFANSTIRIEFFATSPTSITRPIWLNRFSVWPVAISARSAPVNETATATMIVAGSMKLSNWAASTR